MGHECLVAPAGEAFTVNIDNQDAGIPHNFDLLTEEGGDEIGKTAVEPGPVQQTLDVDPLDAGEYYVWRRAPDDDDRHLVATDRAAGAAATALLAGRVRRHDYDDRVTLTDPRRRHPRRAGGVPVPRRRRAGDLRRQGPVLRKRLANYWGKHPAPRGRWSPRPERRRGSSRAARSTP